MSLKAKIDQLNKDAHTVQGLARGLNIRATAFSGVAAVIPQNASFPASHFKGCKVILHNVNYDCGAGCINATITFPYSEDVKTNLSGSTYQVTIDENWFE